MTMGKTELAVNDFAKAIMLLPKDAHGYNNLAWLLATCSDPKYRNGKEAIKNAVRACELLAWKDPGALDTLSAAYAEDDQFTEAVKWQTKAVELAPSGAKKDLQSRLELYKTGKPFRQTSAE